MCSSALPFPQSTRSIAPSRPRSRPVLSGASSLVIRVIRSQARTCSWTLTPGAPSRLATCISTRSSALSRSRRIPSSGCSSSIRRPPLLSSVLRARTISSPRTTHTCWRLAPQWELRSRRLSAQWEMMKLRVFQSSRTSAPRPPAVISHHSMARNFALKMSKLWKNSIRHCES